MKKYAVILAGGSGMRAGGEIPKQFQNLAGIPMLWWSVRAFHREDLSTEIRIVMHPGFFDLWDILYKELDEADRAIPVSLICGGRSRLESVRNGIMEIPVAEDALIAVHDAARPLVSADVIAGGWDTAKKYGTAVPVVPVTDSLRCLDRHLPDASMGEIGSKSVVRDNYVAVQTPQVFRCGILKKAYELSLTPDLTDDASLVEKSGERIALFKGDVHNMKVTNPLDMRIAELIM